MSMNNVLFHPQLKSSLSTYPLQFILLSLIFVSLVLGQLSRLQLNQTVGFYFHDLLILGWLVLWLRENTLHTRALVTNCKKFWHGQRILTAFIGWATVITIGGSFFSQDIAPLLYISRICMYTFFTITLCTFYTQSKMSSKYLLAPLILGSSWVVLAAAQYVFIPDTRFLAQEGWDDHYYRMIGTFYDPNFLGLAVILTLLAGWRLRELGYNKLWLLTSALLIASLLPTFSRGSYLALIFMFVTAAVSNLPQLRAQLTRTLLIFALLLVLCATVFLSLPKPTGEGVRIFRTSTITARLTKAHSDISLLSGLEWITGSGLYVLEDRQAGELISHARLPDNILVLLLTQLGIVGTVLGTFVAWQALRHLYNTDTVAFLALATTLFHSMGTASLLQPFIYLFLAVMIGSRLLIARTE